MYCFLLIYKKEGHFLYKNDAFSINKLQRDSTVKIREI
jgi:hypothetical protein